MSQAELAIRRTLQFNGDLLHEAELSWRHPGSIRQHLDAGFDGAAQPATVFRVDLIGGAKGRAVAALDHEHDSGAVALTLEVGQLF